MRVLFFSAMSVSPVHGGQIVHKLLEPPPPEHYVHYATEKQRATIAPPFAGTAVCHYSTQHFQIRGQRYRPIRALNEQLVALSVHRQISKTVKKLHIDLVLACPQTGYDLTVAERLARSGMPTVAWFMDDYYSDSVLESVAKSLWYTAKARLVISDAMQIKLESLWGREGHVLRSPADFETSCPALNQSRLASPLRVAYTGSLQPYYQGPMWSVIDAVSKLDGQVTLDIFTPNLLPGYEKRAWCNVYGAVPQSDLPGLLAQYDTLLMLSSFDPDWQKIAETSLGSKLADYLACGRPILFYGPPYAENIRYAARNGLGLIVDSEAQGDLVEGLLKLKADSNLREKLAHTAWEFGRVNHDRATNRAQMWTFLENALADRIG